MTEAEWHRSDDAGAMLDYVWEQHSVSPRKTELRPSGDVQQGEAPGGASTGLDSALHRFYLASCRGIWKLLPQEESRRGVEKAEQWLAGTVCDGELMEYSCRADEAAYIIDYDVAPSDIERWAAEVRALPAIELRSMLHPPETADKIEPRELLKLAAYFAGHAMLYSSLNRKGPPPPDYRPFLSAALLRQHVRYPGPMVGDRSRA